MYSLTLEPFFFPFITILEIVRFVLCHPGVGEKIGQTRTSLFEILFQTLTK